MGYEDFDVVDSLIESDETIDDENDDSIVNTIEAENYSPDFDVEDDIAN